MKNSIEKYLGNWFKEEDVILKRVDDKINHILVSRRIDLGDLRDDIVQLREKLKDQLNSIAIPKDVIRERMEETKENIRVHDAGIDLNNKNFEYHRWNNSANEKFLKLLEGLLEDEA